METLTAKKFDDLVTRTASPILWGSKAIGQKIGRSEGWVRKVLARMDGTPVQRSLGGNLFADEDALISFFRNYPPTEPHKAA